MTDSSFLRDVDWGRHADRRFGVALLGLLGAFCPGPKVWGQSPQPEWTLFSPMASSSTYLIDLAGAVRHEWPSGYTTGGAVYLLDGGRVLRTADDPSVTAFQSGGQGGRLLRTAWDGTVEWSYLLADATHCQHHDALPLPNGNVLAIVWEKKTVAEAIAMGRNPATMPAGELWSEMLVEVRPDGAGGGQVVWEWRVWDHLVQSFDATKPNFAALNTRPERINVNSASATIIGADWLHINGLDYNAKLDQILISVHNMSEIWIISHAPTPTAGGDLLYRWGNTAAYGFGIAGRRLYTVHNPRWIPAGLPGAGNITMFNNGTGRPGGGYSSVDEIVPPLAQDGTYARTAGQAFGPANPVWTCDAIDGVRFTSSLISGAQRLVNGDTLVCIGQAGKFVEVNNALHAVWSYTSPFGSAGRTTVFRAERIGERDPRLEGLTWCPADLGVQGGAPGSDGSLDNNDFIAFIDLFFSGQPGADLGVQGGTYGSDGVFDNNDFVVFIDRFFNGC